MYVTLLTLHSLVRWLVLVFLLYSLYRSLIGFLKNRSFSKKDNALRHWTATIAHLQLMIGILLYTQSPLVKYFWSDTNRGIQNLDFTFYSFIHLVLMLTAIILVTIGSALAKRKTPDRLKFQTMLTWFSIALIIILIAIPWPFSPLAGRPYYRTF